MKQKRRIFLLIIMIIAAATVAAFLFSNLSISSGFAEFSSQKNKRLNTLRVRAPYGYYVLQFDVVPRFVEGRYVHAIGGKSIGQHPAGLFGESTIHSTSFPLSGKKEIETEKPVQLSSHLNRHPGGSMPPGEEFLKKCGVYVYLTKDYSLYQKIDGIVAGWVTR